MAAVRCFIALDLPEPVRQAVDAVSRALRERVAGVRWVKPGNVHLTVKFLGDVETDRLEDVSGALARTVTGFAPVALGLEGVGAFPSPGRARVIWVGLSGNLLELNRLHTEVDSALGDLGFERESRPFRPHLTLGRIRNPAALPEVDGVVPETAFDACRVRLIQSDLGRGGATYTTLHSTELKRSRPGRSNRPVQ